MPSKQVPEEKECFGTTIFEYHQNRYHLSVSFSIYRNDFYLDLKDEGLGGPILEIRLERVEEIKVKRDKLLSMPVLLVLARSDREENEKERQMRAIEISLEPKICIRLNNQFELPSRKKAV